MRVLPYGDEAVLLEIADPDGVLGLAAAVSDLPGVLEVVPAARTVLVRSTAAHLARVRAALESLTRPGPTASATAAEVTLEVTYTGADLADTAEALGMNPAELVRRHSEGQYVVAFCGFAPGFAYLSGLDPLLHLARHAEPRTRVPAGSVGIAGEFTGVYPRESPGGWRLLGQTAAPLWNLDRSPPALLVPGTRVRFRPAR